ncbi:MAG: group II truncated hemoglobin [Myxococcales bacterium]|nr:group II truncated hemoglobin [Myxococcales bacterium]
MSEITPYERLGREEGIRQLVDTFYAAMDQIPDCAPIRAMHPDDLTESARRLWMFLVGRFGGPNLFVQERGHPMLRARHMPFAIGIEEAGQWMMCMEAALQIHVEPGPFRDELRVFFAQVASSMVNVAPPEEEA